MRHNSDLSVVADWLELSSLFYDYEEEGITVPECVTYFLEQQVYDSQDSCNEFFESVFGELRLRRQIFQQGYPTFFDDNERLLSWAWTESPALTFCLVLSLAHLYSGYTSSVQGNYLDQGTLFERVTEAALRAWLPGWDVTRTGWNAGAGISVVSLLTVIADATKEVVRAEASTILSGSEKDLGVDIAAVRTFPDGRPSVPVLFAQCASGQGWDRKMATPDTSRWKQFLTLTHSPLKTFSLPFRLDETDYQVRRSQYKGLLMDRLRLLPRGPEADWLDGTLRDDLVAWLDSRRSWLFENYSTDV